MLKKIKSIQKIQVEYSQPLDSLKIERLKKKIDTALTVFNQTIEYNLTSEELRVLIAHYREQGYKALDTTRDKTWKAKTLRVLRM